MGSRCKPNESCTCKLHHYQKNSALSARATFGSLSPLTRKGILRLVRVPPTGANCGHHLMKFLAVMFAVLGCAVHLWAQEIEVPFDVEGKILVYTAAMEAQL